jgi:periodic tryptophan protein 2
LFNPYELEMDVTPAKVRQAIINEEFTEAIAMAIKLNQEKLVTEAVEKTPILSGKPYFFISIDCF